MAQLSGNDPKLKVVLASTVFDTQGFLELEATPDSVVLDRTRRVTRQPTLDGGAFVTDFGYTDSDRTFTLNFVALDRATQILLERFIRVYSEITVATFDGVFKATLDRSSVREGTSTVSVLVKERISND